MTEKELRFSNLIRENSEKIYWKVRNIVVRHEDADDVMQSALMKAWIKFDDFRGEASASTWLYRICVNEAIDFLRKKREMLSQDGAMSMADTIKADDYFDGNETQRLLMEAVESLPEAQRVTFTMRYFNDMSYAEISGILGTSEGGLKANYHIAVKKIKEYFATKV